jgi:basic membrane protein A
MRKSKTLSALTIATVLGLTAAACGSDEKSSDTSAAAVTTAAPTTTAAAVDTTAAADTTDASTESSSGGLAGGNASDITACEVTDVGGVDDKGFNQIAYEGVTRAQDELGTGAELLESKVEADYAPNIQSFLEKDCSVIITVGFLLDSATAEAAKANPDQEFAIVDSAALDNNGTPDDPDDDVALPNVRPLNFATEEPSFLAGYLAAGTTKTGKVATFGGVNIPPVTVFMTGFLNGVNHYNEVKGTEVEVLGWDGTEGSFAGNFESLDDGRKLAQGFVDEGADIIFPVAGPVGLGSSAYATETGGILIIGVDNDLYESNDADKGVYLTSVLKGIDAAVYDTINNIVENGSAGDAYVGTLENEGVGLAPYHDHEDDVTSEMQDELDGLKQDIIDGKIDVLG